MPNSIQTKKQFVLNSIPNQALSYANQLTTQQWNTIINTLRTQTNDNTKYLKELHQWLIGYNNTSNTLNLDEVSFYDHILNQLQLKADKTYVDEKLQLKADVTDIPTKLSQLENDTNYSTLEELNDSKDDLKEYVNDSLNQLENDIINDYNRFNNEETIIIKNKLFKIDNSSSTNSTGGIWKFKYGASTDFTGGYFLLECKDNLGNIYERILVKRITVGENLYKYQLVDYNDGTILFDSMDKQYQDKDFYLEFLNEKALNNPINLREISNKYIEFVIENDTVNAYSGLNNLPLISVNNELFKIDNNPKTPTGGIWKFKYGVSPKFIGGYILFECKDNLGNVYERIYVKRITVGENLYKYQLIDESTGQILFDSMDEHYQDKDFYLEFLEAGLNNPINLKKISNKYIEFMNDLNVVTTEDLTNGTLDFVGGLVKGEQVKATESISSPGITTDDLVINNTLNGTAISNYALKTDVPTKVSQLTNDANYTTEEYVNNLLSNFSSLDLKPVDTLPTEDISTTSIYLLKTDSTEETNIYEEYIYVNNKWEMIGTTKVDLSNYALKTDVPTKVSQLTNDANYTTRDELPTKVSQLENDTNYATLEYVDENLGNIESILDQLNGEV